MWRHLFTKFASYKVPPVMVSTHGSVVPLAMFLKLFMRDAGKEAETERSGAEVQAGERGEEKMGEQDQAREREFWKAGDLSGGRVQAGE